MGFLTGEYENINWNFAPKIYPLGFISNQIKDLFFWVLIIPPILYRVLLIFIYTTSLSNYFEKNNKYRILPITADKAGGLGTLGEVTLYMFYLVIIFFPHLFASSLILGYPLMHKILYPFYFIFAFLIFYLPLNSPHNSMKKARLRELAKIARKYNMTYNDYLDQNDSNIEPEKLLDIQKLYNETRRMPVWPYNLDLFIKFGSVFLTNILIYLAGFFAKLLHLN